MDNKTLIEQVLAEPYASAIFYMRKLHPFWGIDSTVENEWQYRIWEVELGECPCCGGGGYERERLSEPKLVSAYSALDAVKEIRRKKCVSGEIRPSGSNGVWADFDKVLSGEIA